MAFGVAYCTFAGRIILYNTVDENIERYDLIKLESDDANQIEEFFQELKTKINVMIDCLCVFMDQTYKINFRRTFVQISKTQYNIKNVKFFGFTDLQFLGAIENLSFVPKINDSVFIFDCQKDYVECRLWKYTEERQWKHVKRRTIDKTFGGYDKSPTLSDLDGLKLKFEEFSEVPYIYVFHETVINENEFKSAFPNHKKIVFDKIYDWDKWMNTYIRYSLNENKYLKYKYVSFLDKRLTVIILNDIYFDVFPSQTLPFSKTVNVKCKTNDILKVYESKAITDAIKIENENISVTLDIDIHGIYNIQILNNEKCVVTKVDNENKELQIYSIPKKISDYNPEMHAVGIDLGTTECCAAVIRKNGPDFVVLDQTSNNRTMPSYVAFDEKKPNCGQIVVDRMRHYAKHTVYDSKRIIGRDFELVTIDPLWPFKLIKSEKGLLLEIETYNGAKTKTIEEITSILLNHIKSAVESYQNKKLDEVVITIPSEFSEKQKQATKTAAEMAGWKTIHFIPEPVAAAFAYFSEIDIPDKSNILICDCGGGTVDICIAKINNGKVEVINNVGDSYLGGRDFDKQLYNHFSAILKHKYGFDVMESSKKYVLKQKCQDIKHKLSVANEDWLDVEDFDPNINEIIKITKKEFEEICSALIIKMKDVLLRAVTKSSMSKDSINYVFQVGGGCRMPMIKEMLKEIFPFASHQASLYPDWVVAHGAALYAYHIKTEFAAPDEKDVKNSRNEGKNVALMRKMFEKL